MLQWYRQMYLIRSFEERVDALVSEGYIKGTTHLCIGQEAVPVGAYAALQDSDYAVGTHRGHGHIIAKGADIRRIMAELLGKKTGYCRGIGGTQHMAAFEKSFLGTNGITGGGIPIATGAALALKLKKSKNLVVCFLGDGATNQGTFHESLNMASVWRLPVIYLIENNLYAMSTSIRSMVNVESLSLRAVAYGIDGITIDGNDVCAVKECVGKLADCVRQGKGPVLIEALTYRQKGHSRSDPGMYRSEGEKNNWKLRDPLMVLEEKMRRVDLHLTGKLEKIRSEVDEEIDEAVEFAKKSETLKWEEI